MSEQSDQIREQVSQILAHIYGMTFAARYIGKRKRPQDDGKDWECYEWECSFSKPNTKPILFPYYMGLAHATKPKYQSAEPKPIAPHAADVLQSLILDGEAVNESFLDWCANYGYSDDSIKALNTYNECCKTGEILRKFFPREALQALRDALQDY
jgi:hypothetical protein